MAGLIVHHGEYKGSVNSTRLSWICPKLKEAFAQLVVIMRTFFL